MAHRIVKEPISICLSIYVLAFLGSGVATAEMAGNDFGKGAKRVDGRVYCSINVFVSSNPLMVRPAATEANRVDESRYRHVGSEIVIDSLSVGVSMVL